MFRVKYLPQREIEFAIDEISDDEEIGPLIRNADKVDFVLMPPENVDELSDVEDIDGTVHFINDASELVPEEVPGAIEIVCEFKDNNVKKPEREDDDDNDDNKSDDGVESNRPSKRLKKEKNQEAIKKPRATRTKKKVAFIPKWSKAKKVAFSQHPTSVEENKVDALYQKYGSYSPIELFNLFFDDEVINWIVECTINYAATVCNNTSFRTDANEMRNFIGILFVTGYNGRPDIQSYFSSYITLECPLIRKTMQLDRFLQLKRYFHACDNRQIDGSDKFAKVTPLNNLMNEKFMQFGVFSHNLSINEQMIAYHGRHSYKMFLKGKPIRFGYKLWALCSSDGYLYHFIPYSGESATPNLDDYGLGETVVLELLNKVEHPQQHCVAFDDFFTSHRLVSHLSQLNYFCTGKIHDNRTNNAPLTSVKQMAKEALGTLDYAFDKKNEVLMTRWKDNCVVTIASNHEAIEPMCHVKRWDQKTKNMSTIEMPQVVKAYNNCIGGVDLYDNAINKYRIRVRSNKWYWPLLTNTLDAAMVNAWQLHCLLHKHGDAIDKSEGIDRSKNRLKEKKSSVMRQLNFHVFVTECLIRQATSSAENTPNAPKMDSGIDLEEIRTDKKGHGIAKLNSARRCRVCHKHTTYMCSKCNVAIHTKCFNTYHDIKPI